MKPVLVDTDILSLFLREFHPSSVMREGRN